MPVILPITLSAAGAAAILNIWLAVRIGMVRRARHIWMGDGGDTALVARMRAQANFIEYTPITLILVGAIELARPGSPWLLGTVGLFMLGRIAHGLGMDGGRLMPLRMIGALTTMAVLIGLAIWGVSIAADA